MNHRFFPAFPVQTLSRGTQLNDEEEPSFIELQLINAKGMAEIENYHFTTQYDDGSEKAMAPHSRTLAWKIPWTEEPGGLQSMGLLRVGHD